VLDEKMRLITIVDAAGELKSMDLFVHSCIKNWSSSSTEDQQVPLPSAGSKSALNIQGLLSTKELISKAFNLADHFLTLQCFFSFTEHVNRLHHDTVAMSPTPHIWLVIP
jgi:hypothetical protein